MTLVFCAADRSLLQKVSGKKQMQTPPLHGSAQQCNTRSSLSWSQSLQEKRFSAAERRHMQPKGFLSQTAGTAASFWTGNDNGKTNAHGQKCLYTEGRFLSAISNGLGSLQNWVWWASLTCHAASGNISFTVTCLEHIFVYKFSIAKF